MKTAQPQVFLKSSTNTSFDAEALSKLAQPEPLAWDNKAWVQAASAGFTRASQLFEFLNLTPEECGFSATSAAQFSLRVSRHFAELMKKNAPQDPLLKQVLPHEFEQTKGPKDSKDPLDETSFLNDNHLLQKYQGRALLIATQACPIHCRYCFRRHFPYEQARQSSSRQAHTLESLQQDTSIHEVIFSGGDPLSLSDSALASWFKALKAIPHIDTIRLHTRYPVTMPERIHFDLLKLLTQNQSGEPKQRKQIVMVLHINHPQEIDSKLIQVCHWLNHVGVKLLNQSVLLAGINDDAKTLKALSQKLHQAGILPYYLHALDPVLGAHHFNVPDQQGLKLMDELRAQLPGYLIPRFVREIPGKMNKTLVTHPRV